MRILTTKNGYLIVEALISIAILILTVSSAVVLTIYGFTAIKYNKDSLVASMLAQECVNTVRGLRDTNLIRFSYDKDNCWNINDTQCPSPTSNSLTTNVYRLETSLTGGAPTFSVNTTNGLPLDLSTGIDQNAYYRLSLDANNIYVTAGGVGVTETPFFRMMQVKNTTPTSLEAACSVQWLDGVRPRKIELPVNITSL